MRRMTAAVFYGPNRPFTLEEVDCAEPGPDEVLLRIAGAGVCGGDLHRFRGRISVSPLPRIIGHRISGIVEKCGSGVPESVRTGMRVVVLTRYSCGSCRNCVRGKDNLCMAPNWELSRGFYGGFAEFIVVPYQSLIELPDNIPLVEAANLVDSLGTAFHAFRLADVRVNEVVAVFGVGDIGLTIVQLAARQGAIVIAVDVRDRALELARRLGATETINAGKTDDPAAVVRSLTAGYGADVSFEVAGKNESTLWAIDCVGRGSRVVLVGATEKPVEPFVTMPYAAGGFALTRELTLRAAWSQTRDDVACVIRMVEAGELDLQIGHAAVPLRQINHAFLGKESGEFTRVVVVP